MIIPDASVFVKLFHEEEGSERAHTLFSFALRKGMAFLAPEILRYEALGAALYYGVEFGRIAALVSDFKAGGFAIVEPDAEELLLAEKIATTSAPGGGYPDLFDSIYHAMALNRGGVFITADRRHIAKAGHRGAVTLLSDWSPA